jgi:hypothetical protein
MATEQIEHTYTLLSDLDLTTLQYRAVYLGTDGYIDVCTANHAAFGIVQDNYDGSTTPVPVNVAKDGLSFCVYGDDVGIGENLISDSVGRLVPSSAPSTDVVIGVAGIDGTTGDIGMVYLGGGSPPGLSAGAPLIPAVAIPLTNVTGNTAIYTGIRCPGTGKLVGAFALVETADDTSNKAATVTVSTSAGAVTGGVMSLTSANCKLVAAIAATAISGANAALTSSVTITLTASAVTSFAGSAGVIRVYFVTSP